MAKEAHDAYQAELEEQNEARLENLEVRVHVCACVCVCMCVCARARRALLRRLLLLLLPMPTRVSHPVGAVSYTHLTLPTILLV